MAFSIRNMVVDCNDLESMTSFYTTLIGFEVIASNEDETLLGPPDGSKPRLLLQKVPEKTLEKNRLHLDLDVEDLDSAVASAEAIGAVSVERFEDETPGVRWMVMADPEGNLFCLAEVDE